MICSHCGIETPKRNACSQCGRVDLDALRSLHVSYQVNPSRMNNVPPRKPNNSFERGIRRDERGVPFLDKNGSPLRMKESFNPKHYERSNPSIQVSTNQGVE